MSTYQTGGTVTVTGTVDQFGEVPEDPLFLCFVCYVSRAWVAPPWVGVTRMQECRICRAKGYDYLARVSERWLAELEGKP